MILLRVDLSILIEIHFLVSSVHLLGCMHLIILEGIHIITIAVLFVYVTLLRFRYSTSSFTGGLWPLFLLTVLGKVLHLVFSLSSSSRHLTSLVVSVNIPTAVFRCISTLGAHSSRVSNSGEISSRTLALVVE